MTNFVHLHCHSHYSALDGISTIDEITDRCQCLGCSSAALSDHGTVAGHLELGRVCQEKGLKPIYAIELYHGEVLGKPKSEKGRPARDQAHLVVGALNDEGLRNLWRLSSAAATNHHFVPRVTWPMLEKHSEGLFATSACVQSLVCKGIREGDLGPLDSYLEIFRDRFYIELHTYPTPDQEELNHWLVQVAKERGLPLVFASDAHFATKDQYPYHDAYIAMQTGQTIDDPIEDRKMWHPPCLYMMDEDEIRSSLNYLTESVVDEALSNTWEVSKSVNAELPAIRKHLPIFVSKECPWLNVDEKAAHTLLTLVEDGLISQYGENPPDEVWERGQMELEIFLEAGLEHYFLQAWDTVQFCKANNIRRGPGRGSAAGSIVAYALEVTDIDPLRYGLIFERFYNVGREKGGFPDIDTDFPVRSRKVVRDYLKQRWGEDKVRVIGTVTRLKPMAVCDRTRKVCGITFLECKAVKAIIERVPDIKILDSNAIGWSDHGDGRTIYVMDHVGQEIAEWINGQPKARHDILWRWMDFCDVICNRVSGYGVHPSGVVVSDTELDVELPAMWSVDQEELVTQFPMSDVDKRKFLKQDLLGLRNLDTLEEWEAIINEKILWSGLEGQSHPEEMWEYLDRGLGFGIFQIEDGPARTLCQKLKPRSIEDLALAVALIRPGPTRAGAPDVVLACRNGLETPKFDHPILEDILSNTYGQWIYQEQIINYFSALGYSSGEADAVRSVLGKKKDAEMRNIRDGVGEWAGKGYFEMALKFMDQPTAQIIWEKIAGFSKYGFNFSHAVAYAFIAFRTLYAKWRDPAAFYMACIKTNPKEAPRYVSEARKLGIKVLPPDIRQSNYDICLKDGDIYFGFENIKGLTRTSSEFLEDLRSMYSFSTSQELTDAIEAEKKKWEENGKEGRSPKSQFRSNQVQALVNAGAFDHYEPRSVTLSELQKMEREYLGILLTDEGDKILHKNLDLLEECDKYLDLENYDYSSWILPGIVAGIKEIVTKADKKPMGIVKIEYETSDVEFAVFPRDWKAYSFLWRDRTPGLFEIARTDRGFVFRKGQKLI